MSCQSASLNSPQVIPVLNFSHQEVMAARDKGHILSMDIEITQACNYSCIYCYRYQTGGPQSPESNELTAAEITDLLSVAQKNYGLKRVCLLGGEPLLPSVRNKYLQILKKCNELGIEHTTFTNGSAITRETAQTLAKLGASLCIKLNGMSPDVHNFLVDKEGSYDQVMRACELLREYGYGLAGGPQLAFETVVTRTNYEEIPSMWRWARARNITPYVEVLTEQGRCAQDKLSLAVTTNQLESLFTQLHDIDVQDYQTSWDIIPPIAGGHKCLRHFMSIYVKSNGEVCPCVGVDLAMGNIRENSIGEIIHSELAQKTRYMDKHITGKCKTCDLAQGCYGCRGAAHQSGDLFGEDPLCWRNKEGCDEISMP